MSCTSFFKKFIIYVQKVYKSIKCKFDNFCRNLPILTRFHRVKQNSFQIQNSTLFSKSRLFNYVIPKISQYIVHV